MLKLDQTDRTLLALLQTDSKQTTKELSNKLHLSVTAIYERIKKLEKEGIIKNYVAILDKKKIEKNFLAHCHVRLTQHSKDFVIKFEREIIKLEEVLECYHISGDYDYILKIVVNDMDAYRDFMITKLTAIPNIGNTHSIFVIGEVKHTTAISL